MEDANYAVRLAVDSSMTVQGAKRVLQAEACSVDCELFCGVSKYSSYCRVCLRTLLTVWILLRLSQLWTVKVK